MDLDNRSKRQVMILLAFGITILFLVGNCTLSDYLIDQIPTGKPDPNAPRETQSAQTRTAAARNSDQQPTTDQKATDLAQEETHKVIAATLRVASESTRSLISTHQWMTLFAPQPPVITGVSFPEEIPGNQSMITGLLYFIDPDGDIDHIVYEIVSALDLNGSTDYNPRLHSGTWLDGALQINLLCERQQDVTLRVTIYDHAGNQSNSVDFSFTCKVPD